MYFCIVLPVELVFLSYVYFAYRKFYYLDILYF